MTVWGVHSDHPELDLIGNGFVGIGWDDVGDLTNIGSDKEALKRRIAEIRPDAKPGAIPVWAGVLLRFRFEMQVGDLVVYPYKPEHAQLRPDRKRLLLRPRSADAPQSAQGRLAEDRGAAG